MGTQGKPGEGKLWKVGCHSGSVSRDNVFISTTSSKAYATGDKRQLCTATACAPTLLTPSTPYLIVEKKYRVGHPNYSFRPY